MQYTSAKKDPTFDGLIADLVSAFSNCRFDETQSLVMLRKLLVVRPQRILSCMGRRPGRRSGYDGSTSVYFETC
jgi:hypothetical protein